MLSQNNYICALDIGSSKIAAALAKTKHRRLQSIIFDCLPAKGLKHGVIIDSISLIGTITKLMKNLKAKSGVNIKFVCTNISGQDIVTKHSHAIIPLAERGNKVITVSDMQRVNEQARILALGLEEEIVEQIPYSYSIDSKNNIMNPLGLYSHRLEVDLYLVCVKLSNMQGLSRLIHQSGFQLKDLFFSGLATSKAVFNQENQEGLNLFCDMGSDITELLVFKNGVLRDLQILPIGSDGLTHQLCEALKIPFELAEDIKRSHGVIGAAEQISDDKEILVKKSNLYKPIKQKLVCEVITEAARVICAKLKEALEKKVSCYEVDNFVIAGRTVLLEGFIETLENALGIPVKLGRISNPDIIAPTKEDNALSGQKYLTYLTCLGMICEALQEKPLGILPLKEPAKNLFLKAVNRLKETYQEYF